MSRAIDTSELQRYLKSLAGSSARIVNQVPLGKSGNQDLKEYGYGTPVLIEYEADGKHRKAVLHTIKPGPFGHEDMSDRAQSLLWEHGAFNRLPRHVKSIDVGAIRQNRTAVSLGDAEEFFSLTEYGEGSPYAEDLERIRDTGKCSELDLRRAETLCDYLAGIHREPGNAAGLYVRRIRELVGHSECIMGLVDSYPEMGGLWQRQLQDIERLCIDWRWKLKSRVHRLRQVHGDFHPWNVLFDDEIDFCLLDRSRGEWGDPADDVTCLTMNFIFFSLQRSGRLEGVFSDLFHAFWKRYLDKTGDTEMLEVAAPFFVFRGLVMAHPVWYPHLNDDVRKKLFSFMNAVLNSSAFEPLKVNQYFAS
jgi:hypothetical protein